MSDEYREALSRLKDNNNSQSREFIQYLKQI